ncbi:hypothetical protein M405DRAFT_866285 [Rhizopogon salebrosus TDB-379]|nr:hypothetical protein M405DRAFT_866285 [Rhizopogon salebrosus TDB-379]
MYISMFELARRHNAQGLFLFVEHQARGGFRFHTFRASAVVDDAVSSHSCMQRPCDISVVDRRLVADARPFGIISVLAALFLDDMAEMFYFEEEALLITVLVVVLGEPLG